MMNNQPLYALSLTVTERCNLSCKHCGASGSCSGSSGYGEELTAREYRNLLEQAYDLGCRHLIIAGGEPFMRTDIWEIIEHAARLEMSCAILTNGVMITPALVGRLAKVPNLAYVRISVDYPDERMDRFRGRPRLVNDIFKAVRLLRENHIRVGIGMTIMPDNIEDIPAVAGKADEAGANFFRASTLMPIGRSSGLELEPGFFARAAAQMIRTAQSYQPFEFSTVVMPGDLSGMGQSLLLTCPGGDRTASLSSDGKISRCPLSQSPDLPSIRESSLAELLKRLRASHEEMKREVAASGGTECGTCANLAVCHGGCPAEREARSLTAADPQPLCLKSVWKEAFGQIEAKPSTRRAVNNMVCMQSTQNAYNIPVCYRSSPLWWFPLAGQVRSVRTAAEASVSSP